MIEELSLLAMAPGVLIGAYYAAQLSRLAFGYRSDVMGLRTPWIVGGLAVLGIAGVLAAMSVSLMADDVALGFAAAFGSYVLVGVGVGAAGTLLFALIAMVVAPERRAPAATIVWLLMIAGLAVTAALAGAALDPFSYDRLVEVAIVISLVALALGTIGLWGIERRAALLPPPERHRSAGSVAAMRAAFGEILREPAARTFTIFVFASMFAFNMQELVMEPFSAAIFGYTVGESTTLASFHRTGILVGLITAAVAGRLLRGRAQGVVGLAILGCVGSALCLGALALGAFFRARLARCAPSSPSTASPTACSPARLSPPSSPSPGRGGSGGRARAWASSVSPRRRASGSACSRVPSRSTCCAPSSRSLRPTPQCSPSRRPSSSRSAPRGFRILTKPLAPTGDHPSVPA